MDIWTKVGQIDRTIILVEKQKRHEGKSEKGGGGEDVATTANPS